MKWFDPIHILKVCGQQTSHHDVGCERRVRPTQRFLLF